MPPRAFDPPFQGTVHGLAVASPTPFRYLRDGEGERLTVLEDGAEPGDPGELLAEIRSRAGAVTRVHRRDGDFHVHMSRLGWFQVAPETSTLTFPRTSYGSWLEGAMWGLPTALAVLARGGRFLHASAVEVEGRAVILTGPTHHGKTTLAAGLAARGHRLLAEDLVRCHVGPLPLVYPGPAVLRLRKDVAEWLTVPGTERVAEDSEKVQFSIEPGSRGDCEPVPLAGIVLLYMGDEPSLERLEPTGTIPDLWRVTQNIPTPDGRAECFADVTTLAQTAPIWKLTRPLVREALEPAAELVVEAASATS